MTEQDKEAFYDRLKDQLLKNTHWPSNYLFKFIVPTDDEKVDEVSSFFLEEGTVIQTKKSKNGKYTSISITCRLENPDAVIMKYKKVSIVKGIISL